MPSDDEWRRLLRRDAVGGGDHPPYLSPYLRTFVDFDPVLTHKKYALASRNQPLRRTTIPLTLMLTPSDLTAALWVHFGCTFVPSVVLFSERPRTLS